MAQWDFSICKQVRYGVLGEYVSGLISVSFHEKGSGSSRRYAVVGVFFFGTCVMLNYHYTRGSKISIIGIADEPHVRNFRHCRMMRCVSEFFSSEKTVRPRLASNTFINGGHRCHKESDLHPQRGDNRMGK